MYDTKIHFEPDYLQITITKASRTLQKYIKLVFYFASTLQILKRSENILIQRALRYRYAYTAWFSKNFVKENSGKYWITEVYIFFSCLHTECSREWVIMSFSVDRKWNIFSFFFNTSKVLSSTLRYYYFSIVSAVFNWCRNKYYYFSYIKMSKT